MQCWCPVSLDAKQLAIQRFCFRVHEVAGIMLVLWDYRRYEGLSTHVLGLGRAGSRSSVNTMLNYMEWAI